MRRFTMYTTFALIAFVGAVAMAQGIPTKITTLPDHVAVMKSNAQANGALGKALASGAFADASTQVATLRTNLTTIRAFWMGKKNKEAVTIVDSGLMRLDALGKLLAAPAPDQMAAQAAAKEFGGNTCGACHKQFREGDAQTGFKFRDSANQP